MVKNVDIKRMICIVIVSCICGILTIPMPVEAADYIENGQFYTLFDADGNELTRLGLQMFVDDEYISSDNKHYKVTGVNNSDLRAEAEYLDDIELPQFEPIQQSSIIENAIPVNSQVEGNILLYCTHSDESYVPTDGTESSEAGEGGIFDVAETFKQKLEEQKIPAVLDKAIHIPHDAGAYRRSRETAMTLMKKNAPVAAIFDIHRDAVPVGEYQTQLDGQDASLIRIVIGKRNQNSAVNRELAETIKAVADKQYPGLIKDIYMGKGNYNQELSPRSLLFECGTHEMSKEAVQVSMGYLAEVVTISLFGGTIEEKQTETKEEDKDKQAEDDQSEKETTPPKDGGGKGDGEGKNQQYKVEPINQNETKSSASGILWWVIVLAIGVGAFILVSAGSKERKAKMKGFFSREFGEFKRKK